MDLITKNQDPLAYRGLSVLGLVSEYGPNLMQLNTSLTLAEVHQFLDYRVETEIAPKAEGPIAEILHTVQRPASRERQQRIGVYQENYLLKPKPLDESVDQGYMPAITLLANRPLKLAATPGAQGQMGLQLMTAQKEDEETIVIPSDGVGRLTGLENREDLYNKNADVETRRLRSALNRLRIPTLILFPKEGELTELHMQQALYDMNVLAEKLTSTMALHRDNRSPYNAVVKGMFADTTANLRQFEILYKDLPSMIRFVKIGLEGPKVAEKAGAVGSELSNEVVQTAIKNFTYFWSVLSASMAVGTLKDKTNMATGAPGITGLAVVAHELFFGRVANWSPIEKAEAIKTLGAIDWSRSSVDASGNIVLNKTWEDLGLLMLKPDRKGQIKAVMGGAGANNSRIMTAHLLKVIGLDKTVESQAVSPDVGAIGLTA
jgi:hypothetical protein